MFSKLFDFNHPFFKPMGRRIGVVVVCFGWGLFEILNQAPFWGLIFLAMGGIAYWKLFLDKQTRQKLDEDDD